MSDEFIPRLPARPSFEQLRKQAQERLRELRRSDPSVKLADAQFALAREYGFETWARLKHYLELPEPNLSEQFELVAKDLFDAWHGDAAALGRLHRIYCSDFNNVQTAEKLREKLSLRPHALGGATELTLESAQLVIARQQGALSWRHLMASGDTSRAPYRINLKQNSIAPGPVFSDKTWDAIFEVMKDRRITTLNAGGRLTDTALKKLAKLDHVTRLNFDGTNQVTDAGLAHLARMPQLRELDMSGWNGQITDGGLQGLGHLPELRKFQLCWQQNVSDKGLAQLACCGQLEEVNLMGTHSGDHAVAALAGKPHLRQLNTGRLLTEAGIAHLHRIPCFKTWQGGDVRYGLMGAGAWPTRVMIDGPFTDLAGLKGLDGLFGIGFFWHSSEFKSTALRVLRDLPKLGAVHCGESRCDDDAMVHFGALPGLRMLIAQDAIAGDRGFASLGKSKTLEYLWGRDFTGLSDKGFQALAKISTLRGLAVNCENVGDKALELLPQFSALRELTPMNVPDNGFRHIGRCLNLEALWCMYCRDTGDTATQHIAVLPGLKTYYAGASQISDRSLEILRRLGSLERVELWQCLNLTDAGVIHLAALPKLREVVLAGMPGVTLEGAAPFAANVDVQYTA